MMERVEIYSVKDGKAAMGVFIDDIEKETDMQDLDVRGKLEDVYGKGTEYTIITHDGMGPEAGLMYGNDECIADSGQLYTFFKPYGSGIVYKCYYTIKEGEMDWSNIDYASPDDVEISDSWM